MNLNGIHFRLVIYHIITNRIRFLNYLKLVKLLNKYLYVFKVGSYLDGTRFPKMMEEKYSQNEKIKRFSLIVCGLTFVSVVLSLLTYWVYVQWNKVEPKKGKLAIYNLGCEKTFCQVE